MKSSKRKETDIIDNVGPDSAGRLPPQALDLERKVMGALLLERNAYSRIADLLKSECFYDRKHQLIYSAIETLNMNDLPVDYLTVKEQLIRQGKLEESGGPVYLKDLMENMLSSVDLEEDATIIFQKYQARQLIMFASKIKGLAQDESNDVLKVLQEAEGRLFKLTQKKVKKDFTQIASLMTQFREQLTMAAGAVDGMTGIPSGFYKLDKVTAGWQPSDLIIIAARPAMGKTAFVLSMAKNMAIDNGIPTAIFSLEMSKLQLMNRLLSNVCYLDSHKIKTGRLDPKEYRSFDRGMTYMMDKPLYLDETSNLSIFELRTKAMRLVHENGVKIIIIDYLQLMNAQGMNYYSRQEEVSLISRSLKALAKELNIPIIALSQLNRSIETRIRNNQRKSPFASTDAGMEAIETMENVRPNLSDLRESGAIEQDADIVCFIHRPEYYGIEKDNKGKKMKDVAQVIIAKHRNGELKDIDLKFNASQTRFMNPEDYIIEEKKEETSNIIESKMNRMSDVREIPSVPVDDPLAAGLGHLPF